MCLYYNLIYFSEKINFVVVCCCCFTSLDLRARLPDTKIKDGKKMKLTLGLIGAHVRCFSHFRLVISKFCEIIADNSQRFLVICNQVNLNVFSNISNSVCLCRCFETFFHFECIQLCISRFLFQVSKTELFLLRLFDYKFNFRCEF